jgi:hypothetical protein
MSPKESDAPEGERPPFGTWRAIYSAVILWLAICIGLLIWLTILL